MMVAEYSCRVNPKGTSDTSTVNMAAPTPVTM